jgi:FMN phosphatase YigB (HAD superfamily)
LTRAVVFDLFDTLVDYHDRRSRGFGPMRRAIEILAA